MKYIYILLIILTLSSCSNSNSDSTPNDNSTILGRWHIVSAIRGTNPRTLTQCTIDNDFFNFNSNNNSIYEVGNIDSQSNCIYKTYPQTFAVNNSILITKTPTEGKLFEFHYRILEVNTTTLTLQLYYTKVTGNTETIETDLLPDEFETATYSKVN